MTYQWPITAERCSPADLLIVSWNVCQCIKNPNCNIWSPSSASRERLDNLYFHLLNIGDVKATDMLDKDSCHQPSVKQDTGINAETLPLRYITALWVCFRTSSAASFPAAITSYHVKHQSVRHECVSAHRTYEWSTLSVSKLRVCRPFLQSYMTCDWLH